MGSWDTSPAQRARSKAPDFSELFRSANGSRHSSRAGSGIGSNPSSSPSPGEKPTGTKGSSRRSMLPFLGRKKPAEQTAVPSMPVSRKSVSAAAYPIAPVNTVRRSFGNGHAVLMITPSTHSLPPEPPLPSKFPPVDGQVPSIGSKLAAHFTPLRTPAKNNKARHSMIQKPVARAEAAPPVPSLAALSPQVIPEVRTPSIESRHSSVLSRSTTPRPLRGPQPGISAADNGDEEDFSDLFTLPNQPKKSQQSPNTPSATSAHVFPGGSPRKSGELTPTTPVTPVTPLGPPLHFPIPPSTVAPPRSLSADKVPRYSLSELLSLSSQGSKSSSIRPSPVRVDSSRTRRSDLSSREERDAHHRTTSISGSDTDTSRAYDSSYSAQSARLSPVVSRPSSMRKLSASSVTKASSGPPPSVPLPTPPLSPCPTVLVPRSAPCASPNRVVFPRPRANTLSVTSNLVVPGQALPRPNQSSPLRSTRANSDAAPDTVEELREALFQQRRKNVQLQEYIVTITKRYEDDRMVMTKNIEKLERNIRKKMREIEGLRWLVIHNGAVSDIDAAANLARSSFSTQDGDTLDGVRGSSPLLPSTVAPPHHHGPPFNRSVSGPKDAGITATGVISNLESRSDASASLSPNSLLETSLPIAPSLSVIPERLDGVSRAERQRLKEERRASKALRRISAASSLAFSGTDALTQSSPADGSLGPNFDPKQSMDEVMEKLHPFRHA